VPVSQSDFPNAAAHTICSNIGPCCTAADKPFTEGNCEIALRQFYQAFASNAAKYDPVAEGNCLASAAAQIQKCDLTTNSACAGASATNHPHGTVGQACNWSCTSTGSSTSCSGTGLTRSDAGSLVSCFSNDGLYCDDQSAQCAAQKSIGAACTADRDCSDGYCPFSGTANRVCTAKLGVGASCASSSQACAAGLYCDFGGTSNCTSLKPDGVSCTSSNECSGGHCQNGQCGPNTTFLSLACAP
jgi:hypothetical protein